MQTKTAFFFFILLSLSLFIISRIDSHKTLFMIDEVIPVEVSNTISSTDKLNTNWVNSEKLPVFFKRDQFNFSAYILTNHFLYKLITIFDFGIPKLLFFRLCNIIFQIGTLLILIKILKNLIIPHIYIFLFVLFFIFSPLLIQDAHYARPESFFMLISVSTIFFLFNFSKYYILFTGLLIGFGMSTKVSFAPFFLIPIYLIFYRERNIIKATILFLTMVMIGFIIGTPYAVLEPKKYLNGVTYLMNQYAGIHPPHSHKNYSYLSQFVWISEYFFKTHGIFFFLFPIILLFFKKKEIDLGKICILFLICLFYLLYFSTRSVFFARNFSHIVPIILLLSTIAINFIFHHQTSFFAKTIILVVLITTLYTEISVSYQIFQNTQPYYIKKKSQHLQKVEEHLCLQYKTNIYNIAFPEIFASKNIFNTNSHMILKVIDYQDDWSKNFIKKLKYAGLKEVYILYSDFYNIPTSTLHTYHSPTYHYFLGPVKHF